MQQRGEKNSADSVMYSIMTKCYGLGFIVHGKASYDSKHGLPSFLQSWGDLLLQSAYALTTDQIREGKNTRLY